MKRLYDDESYKRVLTAFADEFPILGSAVGTILDNRGIVDWDRHIGDFVIKDEIAFQKILNEMKKALTFSQKSRTFKP